MKDDLDFNYEFGKYIQEHRDSPCFTFSEHEFHELDELRKRAGVKASAFFA